MLGCIRCISHLLSRKKKKVKLIRVHYCHTWDMLDICFLCVADAFILAECYILSLVKQFVLCELLQY